MTLKDISMQVDNLKQIIGEKDIIIKALEDRMISLQNWTQEMYSTLSNKVNASLQIHQGDPKRKDEACVNCKECSLTFVKKDILKKHIARIHPKTFHCENCSEVFDQIWKLEQHMNSHTIVKSHKCDICEKSFALRWRLQKHIRGH